MKESEIIKKYEELYGVESVPYDSSRPLPKNKIAIEVGDDGTVYEHGIGGVNYIKIQL